MRRFIFLFHFIILLITFGCTSVQPLTKPVLSVAKSTVLTPNCSIRALEVDQAQLWYSGSSSQIGTVFFSTSEHKSIQLPTVQPVEFRAMAIQNEQIFTVSIERPAQLFSGTNQLENMRLVYSEDQDKVFYDALIFTDNQHGIAIGDPTQQGLAVLLTHDGGKNWKRIPEEDAPQLVPGEAAFAASNTNIVGQEGVLWVVTGGQKSRIWKSIDNGYHWERIEIPIQQGGTMTGAYSVAFYDQKVGVVAGGNYEQQDSSTANLVLTQDGGKTWEQISYTFGPTYISCIQFLPGSHGNELITVGAGGVFYSSNRGKTWVNWDTDPQLYTVRCLDTTTVYAAGKNKILRFTLQR